LLGIFRQTMSKDGAVHDRIHAVAFTIDDKVYAGNATDSHIILYVRLLRDNLVPVETLNTWTSDDKNHGFVTASGEFVDRVEAFKRFGVARSQDLTV